MYRGRIEVITGCMFAGKSGEMIRRLRRAQIARQEVKAFKHASDDRYHKTSIGCHTGVVFHARAVRSVDAIRDVISDVNVIGIDEAQFFDADIISFCEEQANLGVRVIVAGLDLDSSGEPFGPIPGLMAIAETVTKLHAVCMQCGGSACRSYHLGGKTEQIQVGAGQYEARCRECWLHR